MSQVKLRVAALQLSVSSDIAANGEEIRRLLREAKARDADVAVTPEGALSGYAFAEVTTWEGYDWDALRGETELLCDEARRLGMLLLLGSAHFVDDETRPMNCVYVIDPGGAIVDRYDKSMLTDPDQLMYTAGDHPVVLDVHGVKLGVLVCYDICYPELYARARDMGVEVMLHAFHNAGYPGPNILDEVKPAWIRARAADNRMHVVAVNSSRAHSCWGSCVARPDGSIAASLPAGAPGVLVHAFPDDTLAGWLHNFKPLKLAPDEVFHRGHTASDHPRVRDRRAPP